MRSSLIAISLYVHSDCVSRFSVFGPCQALKQDVEYQGQMMNTNTAAIESLRTFAVQHGEIQFAHLCTAALDGEEWAVERLEYPVAEFADYTDSCGNMQPVSIAWKLDIIRSTDTTRPDGAIARSFQP